MSVREEFEKLFPKEEWGMSLTEGHFRAFQAGRESMREEAVKAVDEQHLLDNTGEDTDYAYTNAINHAIEAIKELP